MGTPMLWRTIIVDTTLWSQSNTKPATLLELLSVSLDRGGSYPLTVRVAVEDEASHGTEVLNLLSRHSHRWQVAHFWTGFQSFQSIASARGYLPLLEKLEISQNDDWDEFDVFEVAPRLTRFTVTGWGTRVPTVPWSQIQWLSYQSFEPNLLAEGLSLLREDFPANNRCDLTMNALDIVDINLPSIVSNVASFILTLEVDVLQEPPVEVLGLILASLTLPCLDTLGLMGKAGEPPLSWHQQHFLAFASRSLLHDNLVTLELSRTTISDDALIECLSLMPLLEQLIIADCEEVPHALITDSLLRRLVWTADPPALVPRLSFLCLTTLLRFSDDVYWDLITSRLVPARWAGLLLEAKIYWLHSRERDFPADCIEKGVDLEAEGEMNFTARLDPEDALLEDEL
ncbi:hypothetical protein C8R47DRAFT_1063299 [Mycena vitilis]|nr:hypothetical protein C8R47DRAFT_1063299 [Mycena vitilis]